jgi:hypothetical protein
MNKTIDYKKLKAKYALEIYQLSKTYPNTEDVLYEIVKVLQDRSLLDKEFKPEDIHRAVKTRCGDEQLVDTIKNLAQEGFFSWEKKGRFTYFLLLTHPWVSETINS